MSSRNSTVVVLNEDYPIANEGKVLGRIVQEVSLYCGSYGAGGHGFLGFQLYKKNPHEKNCWLILTIPGSGDWLNVNGIWLEAPTEQYNVQEPLYSNYPKKSWDKFSPLVKNRPITKFSLKKRNMKIKIGNATITLTDDPSTRPKCPNGELRVLLPNTDLRRAWVISPIFNVRILEY